MDESPSVTDLLDMWLKDTYGKYRNKKGPLIRLNILPGWKMGDPVTKIQCVPCMGYIDILYNSDNNSMVVDGVRYRPEDPDFTFSNVFGPKINNHLWHHQMGPLYEQGWKIEDGSGAW